jgi:hypothetical protein
MGNVGIGTSEPNYLFNVDGNVGSSVRFFDKTDVGSATGNIFYIYRKSAANNDNLQLYIDNSRNPLIRSARPIKTYSDNWVTLAAGTGSSTGYIDLATDNTVSRLFIENDGNIGIGTTAPATKLHILETTEQLRLGYDTSNYVSTTVGSTGVVTHNAVGSGASFVFSDPVKVTGTQTIIGTTNNCILTVDADATCDAGTKIGEDNSIAFCMVCAAN